MIDEPHATDQASASAWSYALTDLVDLDLLQRIQDSFSESNQVASTITDINGRPITRISNHSAVCKIIRSTEKGLANCMKSGKILGMKAAALRRPFHQQCLSCGFTDAAAPIIVEGHHIANWLIGQYYVREVDEHRILAYAEEIGADGLRMLAAFREMPRLSRAQFEKILDFLWLMANEISRMGYLNLLQRRQAQELEKTRNELLRQRKRLAAAVEERTQDLLSLNSTLMRQLDEKEQIRLEQSRLLTAIENLGEAIVITDVEGRILYTNPAFTDITGFSAEEVAGKFPRSLLNDGEQETFSREAWKALPFQGSLSERMTNRRKDGTPYTEESTVSAVRDEDGKVISYVAVIRDISKSLELERQLRQAVKHESIGTLAAGIAHEINTPTQYIGSNIAFLEDAFNDLSDFISSLARQSDEAVPSGAVMTDIPELSERLADLDWPYLQQEIPKTIEQSKEGVRQIGAIVRAMKEFARPGSRIMAPADINALLRTVITISRNEWKYVASVATRFGEGLAEVPCLAEEISHVFLNVILNAAQAIAGQSRDRAAPQGEITIVTRVENENAVILISDNGPGIPEEMREKVFDPFFTTKAVGKGVGQGLAVAYDTIVTKHGGTISCSSARGGGTVFRLTLPLSASATSVMD